MTQKTDPFIQLNWGWDTGEGGWGEGMNQNLIIHAFLQNKRINNILASASLLPAMPVDGDSYFAVADKTLYIRAEGSWYTLQPTVGMVFILKTTEAVMKYDGTTLVSDTKTISEVVGLQTALDAKISTSLVGAVSGVAPLGVDGKVPAGYLPASGSYLGVWNATTNTPTITSGVGSSGEFYKVSVGGSINIDGTSSWSIGDEIRFNGTVWQRIPNTSAVSSVNGYTGSVVLTATDVGAATTSHIHSNATTSVAGFMSASDKTKLDGVATGATSNSPDATLLARANHTGTQAQSTITNLTTDLASKQATLVNTVNIKSVNGTSLLGSGDLTISAGGSTTFTGLTDTPASYTGNALKATRVNVGETALEFVSLGSAAYSNSGDFATSSHTHPDATTSLSGFMSATDKTKLNGVATGATANSSDAVLLARANHTGTQTSSTISDFNTATDARVAAGITGKENTIIAGTTSQYWRGDKSFQTLDKSAVGLSNVDNTSDTTKNSASVTLTNKTISGASNTLSNIAQSSVTSLITDLGLKAPLASPTFSGTVSLPFNTSVGSVGGTEISYLSGVSSSIQTQLNSKQVSLGYTPVNKAGDTMTANLTIGVGSGQRVLSIDGADTGSNNGSAIYLKNNGIANNAIGNYSAIIGGAYDASLLLFSASDLVLHSGGGAKGVLKSNGNLLIGTSTDAGQKLQVNGVASATSFVGDGSSLTLLNATHISSGTVADVRLPSVMSSKTFGNGTGQQTVSVDGGNSGTNSGGYIAFKNGGTTSGAVGSYSAVIGGAYNTDLTIYSGTGAIQFFTAGANSASITSAGVLTASNASGLSQLNASNLSSGTVANARLTAGTTSTAGILQVVDSVSSTSTTTAASPNSVRTTYLLADGANTLASSAVQKATPAQLFQSLGTISGAVSVNGASGLHVLATVNGNTTWTFPSPSATEAMALTLELTNGGAYTMTWPSGTRWSGGVAPTLTASGTDVLVFTKAGTNNWRGYLSSKDSR